MIGLREWVTLAAAVAAVLGILLGIKHYGDERADAARAQVRAQYEKQVERLKRDQAEVERDLRNAANEIAKEAHARDLKREADYADAVRRVGPVRVCNDPARMSGTAGDRATGATALDDGSTDGSGLPESAAGRDIGPGLSRLAQVAQRQTDALITCQAYAGKMRELVDAFNLRRASQ
jgi:hypothetical protein